jgi:hypothetical protein
MKRLSIYLYSALIVLFSCEKDETLLMLKADPTPPKITSLTSGFSKEITLQTLNDKMDFAWNKADYGVNTEVKYTVEIDSKCNSFASPVVIGTTTSNTLSVTLDNLNSKLLDDLKVAPHQTAELQVRVTATLQNKYPEISEIIPITVKPWNDKPFALWMGENAPGAPVLFRKSSSKFEGYKYVKAGTSFRLANNPVCADSIFSDSGTPGKLSAGNSGNKITLANAGYYKLNADTKNLDFTSTVINTWGMIGTATPGGWNTSTPMTYNASNDVWEAQLDLASGALKFRANNDWGINYGPASIAALDGTLIETNDAINIAAPGNYKVTIDFSQSKSPYTYKYTVVKSGNVQEPAKLWLPGGYQGWSPSTAPTIYAISSFVYEGYVYINSGTGFKFTSAPDWDHINYGDAGTAGVLTTDGLANGLSISTAGYYKLKADTKNLTYDMVLVNTWGMIGTATPGAWDTSTPMTYDPTNNVWKATINLIPGALKFRANNDWGLNYGPASIADLKGTLIQTNDAINITEAGSYTVTLDFSRSKAPYQYTYSVAKT